MRVSVIPADTCIVLDGEALFFPFAAPDGLHALQWHGDHGEQEFADGRPNAPATAADVQPFVEAYAAEKARRAAEAAAGAAAYRASPAFEADLLARIDREAEARRARHVTPGSGQALVYQAKLAEARTYLAAGEPGDLAGFPLLASEVGVTAGTPGALARLWAEKGTDWLTAAAAIEAERLRVKAAIRAAATPEAKETAAVPVWPD